MNLGDSRIHRHLVDSLYVEAMVLADEARSYFDDGGRRDRALLTPMERVAFSCESLKVTTRLMHVTAWLLTQRAIACGELAPRVALDDSRRLGPPPANDQIVSGAFPDQARALIDGSVDLYRRVSRLDSVQTLDDVGPSPARSMQDRLAMAY